MYTRRLCQTTRLRAAVHAFPARPQGSLTQLPKRGLHSTNSQSGQAEAPETGAKNESPYLKSTARRSKERKAPSRKRRGEDPAATLKQALASIITERQTEYGGNVSEARPRRKKSASSEAFPREKKSTRKRTSKRSRSSASASRDDKTAPWDVFRPPTGDRRFERDKPSHQKPEPGSAPTHTSYIRRIEDTLTPINGDVLADLEPISQQRPIAKLAHGLDRVLFDPGVHWLQEPRSQVYNFTPWLQNIPNVKDFAFERITGFVKSSRDEDLWGLARREDRGFAGSTSSLTGLLSHIYFLISGDREVDLSTCSRAFSNAPATFTPGQRMPASVMLNHRDGRYTIDSLSPFPGQSETNILTWLGHMLEKFLTASPSEFKKYLRSITPQHEEDPDDRREAYRYSKSRRMVMRSQLDCVDKRLPGTGVFDLKTRAVLPIRMDRYNYEENSGYMIRSILGPRESFEKEYYDLVRSAFLKYSYQARIGNMDGILVAYHNTARIFGFQYMPLEDMEERLYGAPGRGERVFERCVSLLEVVLPEVTRCFPNQSVELMLEAQEGKGVLNIWVQPAGWNEEQDGPAPIVQLDVTARNVIDGIHESGPNAIAVGPTAKSWSIRYSISHMALPDETVRRNRDAARERMFRAHSLPSGLDMGEMEDRWNNMFFGGEQASGQDKAPFNPSFFTEPDRFVQMLRKVARAGKEDLERMELAAHGKPKVVFGDYEPYEPLPRFAPADDIGDGAEGATRSEVSSPPSSHEGQLSSDRSSNVASGASPTPDLYRLDAAPGLEYASSGKAPVPHLTVQPHVVNLAPDFESATGEVNPESKLVPTSKLDTGSDRKQD